MEESYEKRSGTEEKLVMCFLNVEPMRCEGECCIHSLSLLILTRSGRLPKDPIEVVELKNMVFTCQGQKLGASNAKSDTTMARNLLCTIFTREALLQCSVKGNVARGKSASIKGGHERKPPFNPRGVNAIIDYVFQKLRKTMDRVCAMGTRLSELRADAKLRETLFSVTDDEETQLDLGWLHIIAH
ncbi:hypothetical protein BSL78_17880 [Apostichopus japonicus]|uniref:BEN domain-containing protein n=1 Tax=Stichopus japonicus TaxID=307972 RepID=A0A2G8KBC4_STIJA|nr:hypothetical protein BSL78_17880 [Apostichopus japonicus]